MLGDAKLVSLSHDISVGIANLFMEEMNYSWRTSGSEALRGKNRKPDYIYDNGISGDEVVAMESKGSIAKAIGKGTLMKRAEGGYKFQLAPWLGTRTSGGSRIAHGYAIGTWSPYGKNIAELGVHETKWPSIDSPGWTPPPQMVSLDSNLATSNYACNFDLVGSKILAHHLWSRQKEQPHLEDPSLIDEFIEVDVLGQPFLVLLEKHRLLIRSTFHRSYVIELPNIESSFYLSTFAINLNSAKSILEKSNTEESKKIVLAPILDSLIKDARGSGIALFRDGLALLPPGYIQPHNEGRIFQWSQVKGLVPITQL